MVKRILVPAIIAVIFAACGNTGDKENSTTESKIEKAEITFVNLIEDPDNFIGKEITLEGKVVHVCKHSGKKMHIVGEDPDIRLFISAGEEVPKFPMELLGSEIYVTGIFQKIETGADMEKEHKGDEEGEACETEEAIAKQPVLADMVLNYRDHKVK
ncbi:MAG TPA: hypothetical protein DEQ09_11285 [Bacteroidales bacterium]|nr:hypothetical protein [Bacteroidales bacterium]